MTGSSGLFHPEEARVQMIRPPSRRSGSTRRAVVRALMALAAVLAALGVGDPVGAAELCGGSAPAGHIRVAVVVDHGTEPDSQGTISVRCLTVADGSRGADLLRERAALLGLPPPRYAPSGLLCALDGYPEAPECAQGSGAVRYWSYWSGNDGHWVYGSGNPFTRRLRDGDIEGWRFVRATEAQAPPPRLSPDRAALFPRPPATDPTVPAGSGAAGSQTPRTGPAPTGPSADHPAVPGAGAGGGPEAPPSALTEGGEGRGADPGPSSPTGPPASTGEAAPPIGELAAGVEPGEGGVPAGAVAGLAVVVMVGAAALVRFRRSSGS
ncbi:hypothetical protein [Rhabdothermincola sediminis]|uniref:hypothetical protein n=1 Tax=Rhabdothermincola sediminis TaxID=2751370 RepID=UPI001AA045B9|nr:hypothetical protein [Rhabdothermincola sediminis]